MPPTAGLWRKLPQLPGKLVDFSRYAWQKARIVQTEAAQATRATQAVLEPIPIRTGTSGQPLHPIAFLRQSKRWISNRSFDSGARQFSTKSGSRSGTARFSRVDLPKSRVGDAVRAHTGRAPFASTLRPNLTGGTLGRTAGGYGVGAGRAGVRHFSHSPAAPAQVVQNVSQAVRAFFISGKKAHFDGIDPHTGEKRWKAVSVLEDEVTRKTSALPKATPGSYIDFAINPTITAFSPLNNVAGFHADTNNTNSLATEGLIDVLSTDFARAAKDYKLVLKDLQRLSTLGDLPMTYHTTVLRVHFPGCDAESVENLCDELGVQRGVVHQDEDFDTFVGTEIALLFPFAPSKAVSELSLFEEPIVPAEPVYNGEQILWQNMLSPSQRSLESEHFSTISASGIDFDDLGVESNPWAVSSPSGYSSLRSSDLEQDYERPDPDSPLEYQGFEGVYRFMGHYEPALQAK